MTKKGEYLAHQSTFTVQDQEFMQLALAQARLAPTHGDHPFGAVIVKDGVVIGKGESRDKSTGTVVEHAEIVALIAACRTLGSNNLAGATIYSTNEPCPMCATAIFQAKIAEVIFGLARAELSQLIRQREINIFTLAQDSGFPINIKSGLAKAEIQELFADYFRGKLQ